jgi:hypothetical protein
VKLFKKNVRYNLAARIKPSIIKKIFSILRALGCDSQIAPVKQGCLREGEAREQGPVTKSVGVGRGG